MEKVQSGTRLTGFLLGRVVRSTGAPWPLYEMQHLRVQESAASATARGARMLNPIGEFELARRAERYWTKKREDRAAVIFGLVCLGIVLGLTLFRSAAV